MVNQNGKMVVLISPMDNQTQQLENSTETSPLNQRLRDNNSDISSSPSSAVTITTSEQSAKQLLHSGSSHQSIKLLLKIIIDVGILCIGESFFFFYSFLHQFKSDKISFCRKSVKQNAAKYTPNGLILRNLAKKNVWVLEMNVNSTFWQGMILLIDETLGAKLHYRRG